MFFRLLSLLFVTALLIGCAVPLKKRSLLVIGDSNGAADRGWVFQLQQLRGGGPLVNTSLSGNTIGFSDNGQMDRNTLENLTPYLRRGYAEMGEIDEILIALGTNDCKDKFSDRQEEIGENLKTLLSRTRAFFEERGQDMPRIVLLTPPPTGDDDRVGDEFRGVKRCTAELSELIRGIAIDEGYCLVDLQRQPGDAVLVHSDDGIHFDGQGYRMLAKNIVSSCY
ncbi:lysophospholipase L1-like esterase [Lewinella aquimaris]|uniref:Lysophospholipase L1-like esterase n=1 Tax=Neolewinella aquimaris TaxID=1835722 RepID=A0A840E6H2_9BACT|nr:GDSL-type esterase/lipase family protein [Neolewinella aquimaris]MBB4079322.1 lysophospholipase L1-like esterase [Neolewinella aquimaris]